jgi:dihydrofolate synthase/folylpolyglutamate synthase
MSIDGEPVSDEILYEVWNDIAPILDFVDAELEAAGDTKLTFFEALAVLGFAVFADAPVDVLVLEVGMGGEWDSTNVADGDVAVFTKIGIDHAERLGNTIAEIAKTKSGIIKPGAIVVSSEQPEAALEVLRAKAAEVADSFKVAGQDFAVLDVDPQPAGQGLSVRGLAGEYLNLFLPLHGQYQAENAAVAIAAVEAFIGGAESKLMDDVVRVAIADASSPGRLQVVNRDPLTILDAAHNPDGAASLAQALVEYFGAPKAVGVLAVLAEKDAAGLLRELADSFEQVVITKSSSPRAIAPEDLAELATAVFGAQNVKIAQDARQAMALANELRSENVAIVVAGSISLVGDVLALIQEEEI